MSVSGLLAGAIIGGTAILAAAFVVGHFRQRHATLEGEIGRLRREIGAAGERHIATFADVPLACVVWEAGFTIVGWNRQAELTFGFARAEIIGHNLLTALIHPDSRKYFVDATTPLFGGGTAMPGTLSSLDHDGATLTGSWHHALLPSQGNRGVTIVSMCLDLTETRRLRDDTALFLHLIEASDEPTLVLDHRDGGRVRYANAAACRHFGRDAEELKEMRPGDWPLPIGRDTLSRGWWMVAAGKQHRIEAEHRRGDGRIVTVEMVASRIEYENEPLIALRLRDITEQRATEARLRKAEVSEAIRAQELRYRQVFENSSDVLFTLNKTDGWQFQEVNPEASKALGVRAQTLAGHSFDSILRGGLGQEAATALAQHLPYWTQCASTGITCEYDGDISLRALRNSGHKVVYHVKMIPLADDGGIVRIICVAYDITQRHAFERQLLASETHFRTLAENTPDNIARWDTEGRYLYINPTHERTLGRAAKVVIGTRIPDWHSQVRAGIAQVVVTGQAIRAIRQPVTVDGVVQLHDVSLVPEFDANGRVVSVLGLGRDMTDIYRMQDTIRELGQRRDKAIEEERRRIALDLHEDLGQLLTALRMSISTLAMQYGQELPVLGQRSQDMLELVDWTIHSVRDTVASLRPTPLDRGLVPGIEWLAAQSIRRYGLDIHLELPADGAEIADPQATALFRIVQEALTNVARHAKAATVHVALSQRADVWELTIRDDGSGFDPSSKTTHALGLLGMSERAAAIGGELQLESTPGTGTTVKVVFPIQKQPAALDEPSKPQEYSEIH